MASLGSLLKTEMQEKSQESVKRNIGIGSALKNTIQQSLMLARGRLFYPCIGKFQDLLATEVRLQ